MTKAEKGSIKIIVDNRKARFDYHIEDTYEAGIELLGSEVKSIRAGQVNLKDSYVAFKNGEAYLQKAHINVYQQASYNNHEPERHRRLLLHREELAKIEKKIEQQGYTCVPTKLYFKNGRIKLEVGIAKGKLKGDKRSAVKDREHDREMARARSRK
jgi:SsrA-binding protein